MSKVETIRWDDFFGTEVAKPVASTSHITEVCSAGLLALPAITFIPDSVSAATFHGDTSWADYLVPMLEHQGLPLATVMAVWGCLELIINRPASAIEKIKWAVLGLVALMVVPNFIHHVGA